MAEWRNNQEGVWEISDPTYFSAVAYEVLGPKSEFRWSFTTEEFEEGGGAISLSSAKFKAERAMKRYYDYVAPLAKSLGEALKVNG